MAGCENIAAVTDPDCKALVPYKQTTKDVVPYRQTPKDVVPYKQWPDNYGFLGDPVDATLAAGTRISRFGDPGGSYASPAATPFSARGLPANVINHQHTVYEVRAAGERPDWPYRPVAGSGGGGVQFRFFTSLSDLLKQGVVKVVSP